MRNIGSLAAALVMATPGGAWAHAKLLSSDPAANATVAAPSHLELRFSETLIEKLFGADVDMTSMPGMNMHSPMKTAAEVKIGPDGKSLEITPTKPLVPGTYQIKYHVTSADTHRVTGSLNFRVK